MIFKNFGLRFLSIFNGYFLIKTLGFLYALNYLKFANPSYKRVCPFIFKGIDRLSPSCKYNSCWPHLNFSPITDNNSNKVIFEGIVF